MQEGRDPVAGDVERMHPVPVKERRHGNPQIRHLAEEAVGEITRQEDGARRPQEMNAVLSVDAPEKVELGSDPSVMLERPFEQIVLAGAIELHDGERPGPIHREQVDQAAISGPEVGVEDEESLLDDLRLLQDRSLEVFEIGPGSLGESDGQPLPAEKVTARNARLQNARYGMQAGSLVDGGAGKAGNARRERVRIAPGKTAAERRTTARV
jgi:hypothetical protein